MDELKKTLKEAATRLTETYANGLETVFYPGNGKPIPEGTILRTNIPNARFATPEEIARRNQKLAPGDEPMSTNERDTHFAGFAKLLLEDMFDIWRKSVIDFTRFDQPECLAVQQVFARRAYDLVQHTILHVDPHDLDALSYEEIPARIPDMDKWPE